MTCSRSNKLCRNLVQCQYMRFVCFQYRSYFHVTEDAKNERKYIGTVTELCFDLSEKETTLRENHTSEFVVSYR